MKIDVNPEEESLHRGLSENYGYSLYISAVYIPPWWKKSKIVCALWLVYVTLNGLNTSLWLFVALYTIYLRSHVFTVVTQTAHLAALIMSSLVGYANLVRHKEVILRMLRSIGEQVYQYGETVDPETKEEMNRISENNARQKKLLTGIMQTLIAVTAALFLIFQPLVDILFTHGRYFRSDDPDGVTYKLPLDMWYPLSLHNNPLGILLANLQFWQFSLWGVNTLTAVSIMFICYAHTLCGQYEILCLTISKLFDRAISMYETASGQKFKKDFKEDPLFHRCLQLALKDSTRHHQKLIALAKDLQVLYSAVILLLVLVMVVLLCSAGVVFTNPEAPTDIIVLYVMFITTELYVLFIYCWYGDRLRELNSQVGEEMYNNGWENYGKILKLDVLIVQASSEIPIGLTAGGFYNIDIVTFQEVINSAYSYFTILNALRN